MLERMARAMAYDWFSCDFEREDALKAADKDWKDFLGPARAALMAMRPTEPADECEWWARVYIDRALNESDTPCPTAAHTVG